MYVEQKTNENIQRKQKGQLMFVLLVFFCGCSMAQTYVVEDVKIKTRDNFLLFGKFYRVSALNSPAVLLIHQCDINRFDSTSGLESIAHSLATAGFSTLFYFQRGYGKSVDTDISKLSNTEIMSRYNSSHFSDALEVVDILASFKGINKDKLAFGGASCGGRLAARIASAGTHKPAGIMLLSAGMGEAVLAPLANQSAPLLCITAKEDNLAYNSTLKAYKESKHPTSKLIIAEGSSHGVRILDEDVTIKQAVVEFFQAILK